MPPSTLSVCFDAASEAAADLLPALFQLLCATHPDRYGIDKITLFINDACQIDWPEVAWLDIVSTGRPPGSSREATDHHRTCMEKHLQSHADCILISLNSPCVSHSVSLVLASDFTASQFGQADSSAGLLDRIRHTIEQRHRNKDLEELRGVVVFSCYAIARLSSVERTLVPKLTFIPQGVEPQFFGPRNDHRRIEDVTHQEPFVWLSVLTHDSVEPTIAIIEAMDALRNVGAFVKLKLLMPHSVGGHRVDPDSCERIENLSADYHFVEIIKDCESTKLVEYYHESDGFIWGPRSDRNNQFVLYAMACGLPIVAANSEMVKKHLGPKIRYFRSNESDDLANSLERSMADIHFRIIGGGLNHKRSMSYTWEKTAAELFRLIRAYGEITSESEALAQ
ncbi:MAG: glycosyltransferase [Gammaproteobacteria bacterium]|nr:glycosyltransferase [Gammaproteobacteria bacterium]